MRDGWVETTLGEIATLTIGKTPARANSSYWTSDLTNPFCTIADMTDWHVKPSREGVTDRAIEDGRAKRVPSGSLLMSFKLTIGRVGIAAIDLFPNEAIVWIEPDPLIDKRFLALWLDNLDLEEYAGRAVKGKTLNGPSLRAIPVAFPPLAEQRRIVDLIAAVDDAVASAARTGDAAADLYRSALLDGFRAAVESFPVLPLSDLSTARLGKMLNKAAKTGVEEYPYVRNADVQWDEIRLDALNTMYFSESDRKEFALLAGDVLICEGGEVGRTAVVHENLDGIFFQKAIHRVRCGPELLPRFLMHYMRFCAATGGLSDFATSLTIAHLTGEKLRTLPTPAPPLAAQVQLVDLLDSALLHQRRVQAEIKSLAAVRSALLAALLTGDHEIPESYDALLDAA